MHISPATGMAAAAAAVGAPLDARSARRSAHLPPQVTRVLFVRNLPARITGEELYSIFGRCGGIRQVRLGDPKNSKTKGTAFVVMDDIFDAQAAVETLSGFGVGGRYLSVVYYKPRQRHGVMDVAKEKQKLDKLREEHGIPAREAEGAPGGEEGDEDDGLAPLTRRRARLELGGGR